MSGAMSPARVAKVVESRRKPTLALVPPLFPTPQMIAEALAPLPDEFRWQPWGFLLPEVSRLVDEPTGYFSVIELVRDRSFAEVFGQVA